MSVSYTHLDQSAINPQGGQSQLEQATEGNQVDPYLEEGYEKLEDGVYLKEVEGSSYRLSLIHIFLPPGTNEDSARRAL